MNGFFSFEVVSSQRIASNNTCYLTAACTRGMRQVLSFVTFFSSIFYLLNTLCGSFDLMCMSFFILQCNSVLTFIGVLREGKLDQAIWKSLHYQIRGRDLTHVKIFWWICVQRPTKVITFPKRWPFTLNWGHFSRNYFDPPKYRVFFLTGSIQKSSQYGTGSAQSWKNDLSPRNVPSMYGSGSVQ